MKNTKDKEISKTQHDIECKGCGGATCDKGEVNKSGCGKPFEAQEECEHCWNKGTSHNCSACCFCGQFKNHPFKIQEEPTLITKHIE